MRSIAIVFCAMLVLFSFSQVHATIIHVPGDSSTIQGGIDGAVNGDTVLVAPDNYYENINFNGKNAVLASLFLTSADTSYISNTVIDGDSAGTVITFASGEDTTAQVVGFTIQSGAAQRGAGVFCQNASSPIIRHNNFRNNRANQGGGIWCAQVPSPIIEYNTFVSNHAGVDGGGICCWSSAATIRGNTFLQDSARYGGAIYCNSSSATIVANSIYQNRAENGGGMAFLTGSSGAVINNTVDANEAVNGGGIYLQASSPLIKNSIVTNSLSGGGIWGATTIIYCDVWSNVGGDYIGGTPGEGCLSADPQFCYPENHDYSLDVGSPCLGTGEGGLNMGAFGYGCGGVIVAPGEDQSGTANSQISVSFYIENVQIVTDTVDLYVSDRLGWAVDPSHDELVLTPHQTDTVSFAVSIPYVQLGTLDTVFLDAISRTDSTLRDFASVTVLCNAFFEGVELSVGGHQSGYADSIVSIECLVENAGAVADSYSLDISDTHGWSIDPFHYDLVLDTAQIDSFTSTVSIPYVPLGTIDSLALLVVSKANPFARDSAYLVVACDAYVEDWDLTSGDDVSAPSNTQVTAVFHVQNTGLAPDSCFLSVSDSLGWDIQPPDYQLILNPGQQDSISFDIQIPGVPVGTTNKVTLAGLSLTNSYVADTASLLVTCESYNVTITGITDVGNDQGKQVKMKWSSYPADDDLVTDFTIFRREEPMFFTSSSVKLKTFSSKDYPPGEWEWLATIPAFGETLYSATVPTLKDSTIAEGMHWSVFFVRAGTESPTLYFDSPVDSGYSLDNLSPSPPTGLFASHEPAVTKLTWGATTATDFDYYTVYRDTLEGFMPDPTNRISYTIDTSFVDSSAELGKTHYYLTSATDFSGNESDPSNEAVGVRYITGDVNSDGVVDVGDVVFLVGYLYRNGSAPHPLESGDVNCDGAVDIGDVVYLINYLFKGGPPPCEP